MYRGSVSSAWSEHGASWQPGYLRVGDREGGFRKRISTPTPFCWGLGKLLGSSAKVQGAAELVREGSRASDTMEPWQTDAGTVTYNCTPENLGSPPPPPPQTVLSPPLSSFPLLCFLPLSTRRVRSEICKQISFLPHRRKPRCPVFLSKLNILFSLSLTLFPSHLSTYSPHSLF